jgi:hypothetical protein
MDQMAPSMEEVVGKRAPMLEQGVAVEMALLRRATTGAVRPSP